MDAPVSSENRRWVRGLRPFLYWLFLVLVLYGIHTHQRLMEQTRLNFTVTMQGQAVDANATLDGQSAISGQNISLGKHVFAVTHPKGETYSANLSIWYGTNNLGTIDLKRTMGMLSVTADPPADLLVIRGPEWSVTLTNSSGLNQSVPTDVYEIEAAYPRWQKRIEGTVYANQTTPCNIAPHFGGLQLDCNQTDASFQLQATDGQLISNGKLPVTVAGLPPGAYQMTAMHHGHERIETLLVKADKTTSTQIDFQYGTVVFKTSPAGVSVVTDKGYNCGETPLTLVELLPGNWKYTLQRSGYQSVPVSLNVEADHTSYVRTNLVSETYFHALNTARQYMADADYDRALQAANDALVAKPDDASAMTLQHEASGLGHLQRAKVLAAKQEYIAGGKELNLALQSLPDNGEIKELMVSYKQQVPAQIERERVERLARPKKVFDDFSAKTPDADLFEFNELKTSKPVNEVASAIMNALQQVQPTYTVNGNNSPQSETYTIYANQTDAGILSPSGRRKCLIVCGQARDDETQIYFKVLDYKAKHNVTMPGLLAFKDDVDFVPIHPSRIPDMTDKLRAQVQAGVSNLTVRIQGAIGQTLAIQATIPH